MPRGKPAALSNLETEIAKLKAENADLRASAEAIEEGADKIGAPLIREAEKPKSSGTVTIACKWPGGMQLVIQDYMDVIVDHKDGRRVERQMVKNIHDKAKVRYVFGPSMPAMGGVPDGYVLPPQLEGGYALTHGIEAEFWELWLEQNKLADYVKNNIIFALPDRSGATHKARDLKEIKSGAEPLSREVDAQGRMLDRRMPKPSTSAVARITPDYERENDPQRGANANRHPE